MSKYGIKVLGLSLLAALSLMALGAGAAQAVTHEVKILGKTFAELGIDEESISGKTNEAGSFLVKSQNLTLKCQKFTILEGRISLTLPSPPAEPITSFRKKILFEECKTFEFEETSQQLACIFRDDVEPGLTVEHVTAEVSMKIVLLAETRYLLAEPPMGRPWFTKIDFEDVKPGSCPLPELVEVSGSALETVSESEAVKLLLKAAPESLQKEYGVKFKFGESKVTVDGSMWLTLSGSHQGCSWAVV
jgi:hypothetical protein